MEKNGFIPIGKVVGVHGIKGNIKVHSYAEALSVFKANGLILLRNKKGWEKEYSIKWAKPHKRIILMALKGVTNINTAEELIGSEFYINKAILPELEEGTYYWFDIIGLSVYTTEDKYLGQVESIIQTGSNDVYVVKDPNKNQDKEILIPALESIVSEIVLDLKIMRVNLPEGLC